MTQPNDKLDDDLRYGDHCPRCNAASGIDICPNAGENCPIARDTLPPNYYKSRVTAPELQQSGETPRVDAMERSARSMGPRYEADQLWALARQLERELAEAKKLNRKSDELLGRWQGIAERLKAEAEAVRSGSRTINAAGQAPAHTGETETVSAPVPAAPVSAGGERPCETCEGDPEVCATVPGLRHCEAAARSATMQSNPASQAIALCDEWINYRLDNYDIQTTGVEKNAFLVGAEEAYKRAGAAVRSTSGLLAQTVRELVETAGDHRNSDDYIGKVFRARLDELTVQSARPLRPSITCSVCPHEDGCDKFGKCQDWNPGGH